MTFQTQITVPARDVQMLMDRLAQAGAIVLDTGERVATDAGPDAEACLAVCFFDTPQIETEAGAAMAAPAE